VNVEDETKREAHNIAQRQHEHFFSCSQDMMALLNRDFVYLMVNDAYLRAFGKVRCDVVGHSVSEVLGKDLFERVIKPNAERCMAGPTVRRSEWIEFPAVGKRYIDFEFSPFRGHGEDAEGFAVVGRDNTDHNITEKMLRAERDRSQMFLDIAEVGFLLLDSDGTLQLVNQKACEILECAEDQAIGANWFSTFLPQRLRDPVSEVFKQLMAGLIEPVEYYENAILTKTGKEKLISFHNTATRNSDGEIDGVFFSAEDITDQRRTEAEKAKVEEQLHHAQKMDAIGRLAGGVAHDFNNILCTITGNANLVLEDLPAIDPLRESMEEIAKAAYRAAELTRQLLTFSRKQVITPKVIDLSELVESLHTMLARLIGEHIILRTVPQKDLDRVRADPSQIEQVVLNLTVNARDAMPDGGQLSIETANVVLDETYCSQHPNASPGDFVMIMVTDTGCGMSSDVLDKIFEPFFTTKQLGQGTGLGLATVFGIVDQNGGSIEVCSEQGKGSSFKVYLPRVLDKTDALKSADAPESIGGKETILVVEDDQMVRNLAVRLLKRRGFKVLASASGYDALTVAEQHDGHIDLLLTDVVMPHMNGVELAERFAKIRPEAKVLYTSGYAQSIIAQHGVLDERVQLLAKPYSLDTLSSRVREVLDS